MQSGFTIFMKKGSLALATDSDTIHFISSYLFKIEAKHKKLLKPYNLLKIHNKKNLQHITVSRSQIQKIYPPHHLHSAPSIQQNQCSHHVKPASCIEMS